MVSVQDDMREGLLREGHIKVDKLIDRSQHITDDFMTFPRPETPESDEGTYNFPSNADNLSDEQLENWLVFFGSWRGYTINRIAELEAEIGLLSEGYDLIMVTKTSDLEISSTKKLLKETLKGIVLNENSDLYKLHKKLMISRSDLKILKGRLSLYDVQFEAISRVITRRGQERQRA